MKSPIKQRLTFNFGQQPAKLCVSSAQCTDKVFECDTSGSPLHAITRVCSQCTFSAGMTCYGRCWIGKPLHAGPSACCSILCTPGLGFQSLLTALTLLKLNFVTQLRGSLTLLTALPVQNCGCANADSCWTLAAWALSILSSLVECVGAHRTVSCCRKLSDSVNHIWTTEKNRGYMNC